eukprot:6213367-Pleurochrysis_carterae.AAC.5
MAPRPIGSIAASAPTLSPATARELKRSCFFETAAPTQLRCAGWWLPLQIPSALPRVRAMHSRGWQHCRRPAGPKSHPAIVCADLGDGGAGGVEKISSRLAAGVGASLSCEASNSLARDAARRAQHTGPYVASLRSVLTAAVLSAVMALAMAIRTSKACLPHN